VIRRLPAVAAFVLATTFCPVAGATVYQGKHAARVWARKLVMSKRTALVLRERSILAAECGLFPAGAAGSVPL
jgi:hypothetical protein